MHDLPLRYVYSRLYLDSKGVRSICYVDADTKGALTTYYLKLISFMPFALRHSI